MKPSVAIQTAHIRFPKLMIDGDGLQTDGRSTLTSIFLHSNLQYGVVFFV
jgi:hypothetical protein